MYHEYTAVRLIQKTTKSEPVKMKNGDMNQSKKRLEYIAGIAGNCPSQEGFKCKEKPNAFKRKGTVEFDIWLHHKGILRQCPQESPLANGQILIDGQLGSQLKTLDEGFKKIMKGLQALLKVELRGVRRDKRRQGDAEDEQTCSSIKRFRHKVRVMDLDQIGGVL
ncbi:hypothetical protein Bca52824_038193 [Brassica carinata]|uniref:Uncharacterized protein n=1 Tax=Brassica carinata TaxID=52824 RepID=A0A8X7UUQ4_BRACI|nr:hypothetical protein Bca52824_038193 [Brassica carinata]